MVPRRRGAARGQRITGGRPCRRGPPLRAHVGLSWRSGNMAGCPKTGPWPALCCRRRAGRRGPCRSRRRHHRCRILGRRPRRQDLGQRVSRSGSGTDFALARQRVAVQLVDW